MNINPYLFFDGNCREAFEFYARCLGVEVKAMLSMSDGPGSEQVPADKRDLIMHACIAVGDDLLMASDWGCGMDSPPFEAPRGFSVSLNVDSVAEAERVYTALAEGGRANMPLDKTFFAERFGMLTDRFGVPWMVNCEKDG
ncbi:MAG TPA: VOC family protein [Oleiagrimonas sp.]|nr:VOC family protein [Oleiagrimonas sp.]